MMCRVLLVSSSGYYQWRKDLKSAREQENQRLIDLIKVLHAESFGSYGVRRISRELKSQGILVNAKRIRRLMRKLGIKGKGEPKRFVVTTDSNHNNPVAENELNRNFIVEKANTVWTSDITYIWTKQGWLYLAVIIDLFSRLVVGWATSLKIDTDLICLALEKAYNQRNPDYGLLLHSDRGVQYTSDVYRKLVYKYGMRQSMSRKANCWDNAVAESFFRSLKVEAIQGVKFENRTDAEKTIFNYIENFYNNRRLHSFLLYKSPKQWEIEVNINPALLLLRQKYLKKSLH